MVIEICEVPTCCLAIMSIKKLKIDYLSKFSQCTELYIYTSAIDSVCVFIAAAAVVVGRFDIALFSTLQQTHCAIVVGDSKRVTVVAVVFCC